MVDSQAGSYSAIYDAGGGAVSQQWANGVAMQVETNEAGSAVGITYTQVGCAADDCTLFSESLAASVHGQVGNRTSSLSQQEFSYDVAGRVTSVRDTVDSNCVTRKYGYGSGTNRTETSSYDPAEDGACQTDIVASQITRGYDKADRLTTTGYEYDALGRTRVMPAADSVVVGGGQSEMSYYTTDMAQKIVQDDRSSVYQLDVVQNRYRSWAETRGGLTTTKINHYSGDSDSPSWTDEGDGKSTRSIFGVSGMAGSYSSATGVTSFIINLHGDIVAGMTGMSQGLSFTSDYLEDGQLRSAVGAENHRYGWLGAEQRASDTPNGLTLMGVRLYNPATSRFLSVDPIRNGNANDYDYCAGDSVNCTDLSGEKMCSQYYYKKWKRSWWPHLPYKWKWKWKCNLMHAQATVLTNSGGGGGIFWSIVGALKKLANRTIIAGLIVSAIGWLTDVAYSGWCRGKGLWFKVTAVIDYRQVIPAGAWVNDIGCR